MFYLANKENNRKVVEQDGKYFCEYNCKLYDEAEWRYNVYMKIADFTKSCFVTAFQDQVTTLDPLPQEFCLCLQAEELLGMSAASLEEMRRESEEEYKSYISSRMFQSWSMKLKSEARENARSGEVELRHNVISVRPMNTREEAQALLDKIKAYQGISSVWCVNAAEKWSGIASKWLILILMTWLDEKVLETENVMCSISPQDRISVHGEVHLWIEGLKGKIESL